MEEIKIIMEALAKMGENAQMAFVVWCIKEVLVYLITPLTFGVIGFAVYKILPSAFKACKEKQELIK